MKYFSICSGIEAASVAWEPLGWHPVGFSEIEPFPSAVLAHRFQSVKNYGDMTKYKEWENVGQFDVLVGGTPCQSFSVAGLRKGLDDPRGNLMLTFGAIADHFKPTWIVWENVPGVLSSNGGRDFGTFLGMLGELGYGFAYRILDAQYVRTHEHPRAVPQRRRRVFVVGYLGDWRRAAAVLFDSESLSGNPPPSREEGKGIAFNAQGSSSQGLSVGEITPTLDKSKTPAVMCLMDQGGSVMNIETDVTGTLRSQTKGHEPVIMSTGHTNSEITSGYAPTLTAHAEKEAPIVTTNQGEINGNAKEAGRGTILQFLRESIGAEAVERWIAGIESSFPPPEVLRQGLHGKGVRCEADETGSRLDDWTLSCEERGCAGSMLDMWEAGRNRRTPQRWKLPEQFKNELDKALSELSHERASAEAFVSYMRGVSEGPWTLQQTLPSIQSRTTVRRLTPRETERLQGFPDDWTKIPWRGKPADDCPDGARYKACGNSMAVPVMRWIGERIKQPELFDAK